MFTNGPKVQFDDKNLPARLRDAGIDFDIQWVDIDQPSPEDHLLIGDQMANIFVQSRQLAQLVSSARSEGRVPILSTGGCVSSVGVVAGLADDELGLIWFDGHADSDTPETDQSGSIEAMGAAICAGHCYRRWAARIPGFVPVPDSRFPQVGLHITDRASGASDPTGQILLRGNRIKS